MKKSVTLTILIVITFGLCDFLFAKYKEEKENITDSLIIGRDYAYEAYCDSIWNTDKDYYLDVLVRTEEYQLYIESHGAWWTNSR